MKHVAVLFSGEKYAVWMEDGTFYMMMRAPLSERAWLAWHDEGKKDPVWIFSGHFQIIGENIVDD